MDERWSRTTYTDLRHTHTNFEFGGWSRTTNTDFEGMEGGAEPAQQAKHGRWSRDTHMDLTMESGAEPPTAA